MTHDRDAKGIRRSPRAGVGCCRSWATKRNYRQVLNDARSCSESPKYLEQPLADLLVTLWMKDGAESSRPDD